MKQNSVYSDKDKANENLIGKIKQLEDVNHIIAHNLRGAGANIKLLADILTLKMSRAASGRLPEDEIRDGEFTTGQAIAYIQESTNSFLDTLNTLMLITEADLDTAIKYDCCNIAEIVDHIVQQLHGFVHQKRAEIILDLALPCVSYPKAYMESMLYNFINNALKYSRPGVALRITVATYMQHGRPVISVKDNGLGIDLEKYGKKLFQLNQVFHSGYESKGIGLFITRTQIESLGGQIAVKSVVNESSEFIVVI